MEFLTAAGAVIIIAASQLIPLAIMFGLALFAAERIRLWSILLVAVAAVLLYIGGVDPWFTTVSTQIFQVLFTPPLACALTGLALFGGGALSLMLSFA